jgi:hypothetical protein
MTRFAWLFAVLAPIASHAGDARYSVSTDDAEVTDSATGLIWRRCLEGMHWSGSICEGTADKMALAAADARAQSEAGRSGKAWRLPSVSELEGITIAYGVPPFDETAFPGTPAVGVWSSTVYANSNDRTQYVHYANGTTYFDYRSVEHAVRLVRAHSPKP